MARPPNEWPIPVYLGEMRERVIAGYRVPARVLAERVPPPLTPELRGGEAIVSLCLSNGRCFKAAGSGRVLASELHAAELVTPVRWQGACRPPLRGLMLLSLLTDSPGLARLLSTCLHFECGRALQEQGVDGERYRCRLQAPSAGAGFELALPRPLREGIWSGRSAFDSLEAAEAALLHPEAIFAADSDGRSVRAVPVHQYARSTVAVAPARVSGALVAALVGARPEEMVLDHVLFQKRCTHTWSFPPERIPVVPGRASRCSADAERLAVAA